MTNDLISRQAAIKAVYDLPNCYNGYSDTYDKAWIIGLLEELPSAQPEIIRCKDCKHQEKFWHGDKRRKDGGYYIYGCELAEGYSHVCLDDDFCSRAERRSDE